MRAAGRYPARGLLFRLLRFAPVALAAYELRFLCTHIVACVAAVGGVRPLTLVAILALAAVLLRAGGRGLLAHVLVGAGVAGVAPHLYAVVVEGGVLVPALLLAGLLLMAAPRIGSWLRGLIDPAAHAGRVGIAASAGACPGPDRRPVCVLPRSGPFDRGPPSFSHAAF